MTEKFKELKAEFDKSQENFKKSLGESEEYNNIIDHFNYQMDYLWRLISSLSDDFYRYQQEHSEGHLPKILGAEKMENALESLGIDRDYEVKKPIVFARQGRTLIGTIDFSNATKTKS